MFDQDQSTWVYEQMAPMYWNYRELSEANLNYLIGLPQSMDIQTETGSEIHLLHKNPLFFREPRIEALHSSNYLINMSKKPFTRKEYTAFARDSVLSRSDVITDIETLSPGVYAFGHNHIAWSMRYKDKLFINPGSCGMPCDFNTSAPYAIIETIDHDWYIEERRVAYDIEEVVRCLIKSELYRQAEIWSRIMIHSIRHAGDYIAFYLRHVEQIATERRYSHRPVSNEIWREAADLFKLIDIWAPTLI
jgi:predicted phosphodiesterase